MHFERTNSCVDALLALPLLAGLDVYYPDFQHWYVNRVVPGVVTGNDILVLAKERGAVVGVALGKRGPDEIKLRCVRLLPQFQQTGAGIRLIDNMLEQLECETPHCTVAEELLHTYARAFVNRYGFSLSSVDKGRYRAGKLEYAFN